MDTEHKPIEYAVVDKSKKTKKKNEKQEKVATYIIGSLKVSRVAHCIICTAIVPAYAGTYLRFMCIHIIM